MIIEVIHDRNHSSETYNVKLIQGGQHTMTIYTFLI